MMSTFMFVVFLFLMLFFMIFSMLFSMVFSMFTLSRSSMFAPGFMLFYHNGAFAVGFLCHF